MEFDIIAGIDYGTNTGWVNNLVEACQKTCSANAARKHDGFVGNVIV